MEKEDGRKLSATALEERRKTIVRMWRAGKSVAEIREATSASCDTVYRIWDANADMHRRGKPPAISCHWNTYQR